MQPPWSVATELSLYLTKLPFVPAACQLSAAHELTLLRAFGTASSPEIKARIAFLDAALDAGLALEAAEQSAINNPWATAAPPSPQLVAAYPPRPNYVEFDGPLDPPGSLLQPEALAGWQKKLASLSYSRPEEVSCRIPHVPRWRAVCPSRMKTAKRSRRALTRM